MSNTQFVSAMIFIFGLSIGCGESSPEDPRTLAGVPGDDGAGPAPEFEKLKGVVGAAGGELVGDVPGFEGFRLVVPDGALTEETEITVELALDPTPLPELAAAIGPQFRILPADLSFSVPASITLPFDEDLRQQGDATDEECQAWIRSDGDWVGVQQTSSTPTSVTVPLTEAGVIGAGLFIKSVAISCVNCQPAPQPTCVAGGNMCLEKIGTQHTTMTGKRTWFSKGVIYWLTVPIADSYALTGFDTLTRSSTAVSSPLTNVPLVSTWGDVVVDKNGSKWLGFNVLGNVEFPTSGPPIRFDAGTTTQAAGVVLDRQSGTAIRLRTKAVTINGAPHFALSGVSQNLTMQFGAVGSFVNVFSVAPGVTLSTPIALALAGSSWGTSGVIGTRSETFPMARSLRCGSGNALFMNGPIPHPRKNRWGTFCQDAQNDSFLQLWDGSGSAPTLVRQSEVDSFTLNGATAVVLDADENWWIAYSSIPQLTQVRTDGGLVTFPLTTASVGTTAYNQMLGRGLHYEPSSDTLYLVTRGTGTRGDIYEISNLP